jgi:curved DNA-binding protein CbpA
MTDVQAREILGVPPSANFDAIKAAWRKASQQYHPDKHEGLPERLRKAAEAEMKRINEAYRFLEASTASDF